MAEARAQVFNVPEADGACSTDFQDATSVMAVSTCTGSESCMAVDSDTLTDKSDDDVIPSRSESELSFSMDTRDYEDIHEEDEGLVGDPTQPNSGIYRNLRIRKNRRPVQEKVRLKRQTLRDMTKPLKQWLYTNRDNPYPSKADKVTLARSSQMTMTQVSNWFANARRRLKNTVAEPDLSWSKRIKRYNKHANGNQELLSISSGSETDTEDDKTETDLDLNSRSTSELNSCTGISSPGLPQNQQQNEHARMEPAPPAPETTFKAVRDGSGLLTQAPEENQQKFGQSILSRYLNDSYQHQQSLQLGMSRDGTRHRNPSGSLSSHDFEDLSSSSRSTPIREQLLSDDGMDEYEEFSRHWPDRVHGGGEEDLYWKEIGAALALTTLARSRHNSGASTRSKLSMQ